MRLFLTMLAAAACVALAACDYSPNSSLGFRLPDGDAEQGRAVFAAKQCSSCHVIVGMEDLRNNVDVELTVPIGGMSTRVDTYGELVTSVINPSHRIARGYRSEEYTDDGASRMRNYNDDMTVSELINLVAFLQEQYTEFPDY